jgi:hypothetical protein
MVGLFVCGAFMETGCIDEQCSTGCPADHLSDLLSTANLPSALVEVVAESPCTATLVSGDDDGGVTSVVVGSDMIKPLTCHLYGRLADGEMVAATISFQSDNSSCCPGFVASEGGFTLTDAGLDGL